MGPVHHLCRSNRLLYGLGLSRERLFFPTLAPLKDKVEGSDGDADTQWHLVSGATPRPGARHIKLTSTRLIRGEPGYTCRCLVSQHGKLSWFQWTLDYHEKPLGRGSMPWLDLACDGYLHFNYSTYHLLHLIERTSTVMSVGKAINGRY